MPLYHPSMYGYEKPAESAWQQMLGPYDGRAVPLRGDFRADVAVLGGGFTGLSAALHLARDHGLDACVLDAGEPGWGASGSNDINTPSKLARHLFRDGA